MKSINQFKILMFILGILSFIMLYNGKHVKQRSEVNYPFDSRNGRPRHQIWEHWHRKKED